EDVREQVGVIAPFGRAPVRRVNVLLHAAGVESAKREAVDGEWVNIVFIEKTFDGCASRRVGQLASRVIAQSQAKPERFFRSDASLHRERLVADGGEIFRPALAAMDV